MEQAMPTTILAAARAEALFASPLSTGAVIDRAQADAAIRSSVATFHVRGCALIVAGEYGDHPELAVPRMRWAADTVAELYARRACGCPPLRVRELAGVGR
jgi:hypothetical protein